MTVKYLELFSIITIYPKLLLYVSISWCYIIFYNLGAWECGENGFLGNFR